MQNYPQTEKTDKMDKFLDGAVHFAKEAGKHVVIEPLVENPQVVLPTVATVVTVAGVLVGWFKLGLWWAKKCEEKDWDPFW